MFGELDTQSPAFVGVMVAELGGCYRGAEHTRVDLFEPIARWAVDESERTVEGAEGGEGEDEGPAAE